MSDLTGSTGDPYAAPSRGVQIRRGVRKAAWSMKWLLPLAALCAAPVVMADEYDETGKLFHGAGKSAAFFDHSYAHAIFPSVGKGAAGIGVLHGTGKVFRHHRWIGDASVTQVSLGPQVGGQTYAEIIFFKDKRAFDEFAAGNFNLAADASAVVIASGASSEAAGGVTTGGASGGEHDALTAGGYSHGVAVFTIIRGGAMLQASLGGQRISYRPRADAHDD